MATALLGDETRFTGLPASAVYRWFTDPEAGAFVKRLWALGQKFTAEQLLLKNGGGMLGTDQVQHHIERTLGR